MNIWVLTVEDEHGSFGGTISKPCVDKESAKFWLYNHLRNLTFLSIINFHFTSFENFDNEVKEFEYRVQNEYSRWEYGGRYYIHIYQTDVYSMDGNKIS